MLFWIFLYSLASATAVIPAANVPSKASGRSRTGLVERGPDYQCDKLRPMPSQLAYDAYSNFCTKLFEDDEVLENSGSNRSVTYHASDGIVDVRAVCKGANCTDWHFKDGDEEHLGICRSRFDTILGNCKYLQL